MKSALELDPELRALLEEIAADPRSRLRLAPRHALRSWYVVPTAVRPSELDATTAERHLIAAHREAVASLYCQASRLSYWKRPVLAHLPRSVSGDRLDLGAEEVSLRRTVGVRHKRNGESDLIALLASLKGDLPPRDGVKLASAALALVPSTSARLVHASHLLEEGDPNASLHLHHVAKFAVQERERALAMASLGATHFESGQLDAARDCYRCAQGCWPEANLSLMNLALLDGRDAEAVEAAIAFDAQVLHQNQAGSETFELLRRWSVAHPSLSRPLQLRFLRVKDRLPQAIQALASAYDSSPS